MTKEITERDRVIELLSLEQLVENREEYIYDQSPDSYENESSMIPIMPGLSQEEKMQALVLYKFSKGVMTVSGPPGSGKGLFSAMFVWKMKRLFGKRVILDFYPRELMGPYTFFDMNMFVEEMVKMHDVASGKDIAKAAQNTLETVKREKGSIDSKFNSYMEERGKLRFQDAVMSFEEFHKYMDKRNPGALTNRYIGGLIRLWRHLDLLIIGQTQDVNADLDRFRCLPYVTHDVRCQWSATRKDTTIANIYPMRFVANGQVVEVAGRPFQILVDGGKKRPELGGKRYFDLYPSKNTASIVTSVRNIKM